MIKINKNQAQEIINLYVNGECTKSLSIKFNISKSSILNVINGISFKDCIRPKIEIIQGKLNKQQVENIINSFLNGEKITKIAKKYQVTNATI